MVNSRDNLIEGLPAVNEGPNGNHRHYINTEMTTVNVANREPVITDEIQKRENTINDILQKNGKAVSSTGFSAILFVNNATEVSNHKSSSCLLYNLSVMNHKL